MTNEQRDALIETFVGNLRAMVDSTDDPHMAIWLALHASAGITADLGSFERDGVRVS